MTSRDLSVSISYAESYWAQIPGREDHKNSRKMLFLRVRLTEKITKISEGALPTDGSVEPGNFNYELAMYLRDIAR